MVVAQSIPESLLPPEEIRQNDSGHGIAYWLFPIFFVLLFLFPLSLLNTPHSHYNEKPIPDRRLNLRGLDLITTNYLNANPEAFPKLIHILNQADEALQEEEFPSRSAVLSWLNRAMEQEGFKAEMPVNYYLQQVYLKGWENDYFHQIDDGEREYLYDLMGAVVGGLYRCTCVPPGTVIN